MPLRIKPDSVRVDQLRVTGATENTPALRSAVNQQIGCADVIPRAIAPSAILIVKRLSDPAPRLLAANPGIPGANLAWQLAMARRLEECCRRAVRPVCGRIPSGAEAVLFHDEAELVACLALAVSRNEHLGHWWCRVPLRHFGTVRGLAGGLLARSQLLPGLFANLSAWMEVVPLMRALQSDEAKALLLALIREYRLNSRLIPFAKMDQLKFSTGAAVETEVSRGESTRELDREFRTGKLSSKTAFTPFWERYTAPIVRSENLSWEKEMLLGLSLVLHFQPSAARSEACVTSTRRWCLTQQRARQTQSSNASDRADEGGANGSRAASATAPKRHLRLSQRGPSLRGAATCRGSVHRAGGPVDASQQDHVKWDRPANGASRSQVLGAASKTVLSESSAPYAGKLTGAVSKPSDFREGVRTRLGGLFYLLNVLEALDLPDCFASWRISEQLGSWGLLELLARSLLAGGSARFGEDPVWQGLAELDGRAYPQLPGEEFVARSDFALPRKWFEVVPQDLETLFYWGSKRGRLRAWSPHGFLMFEKPRSAPPSQQARSELEGTYRVSNVTRVRRRPWGEAPSKNLTELTNLGLNRELCFWLERTLPFVEYWLGLRLDCHRPAIRQHLQVPATFYLASSHVDVVMPLESISLKIRCAGLDRDPGWSHRLGRVVLFHFQ